MRFVVHLYLFVVDLFIFLFLNLTGIFLYVFSKDLMVTLLDLIFQVYKWLKWRVQPQTSFLTSKKPILEMLLLFIIFLEGVCVQLKTTNTFMLYGRMIFLFLSKPFIFSTELVWFFMFFPNILWFLLFILFFRYINVWNEEYNHRHLF